MMARVHALTREEAPTEARPAYDANVKAYGQLCEEAFRERSGADNGLHIADALGATDASRERAKLMRAAHSRTC